MKTWKKTFDTVTKISIWTKFTWNGPTKMLLIDDEHARHAYVKVNYYLDAFPIRDGAEKSKADTFLGPCYFRYP